jgi:hypothetical protein
MVQLTRVTGPTDKQKVRANSSMLMGISMKERGSITRAMGMASTLT